jgi:hypothetical protein
MSRSGVLNGGSYESAPARAPLLIHPGHAGAVMPAGSRWAVTSAMEGRNSA